MKQLILTQFPWKWLPVVGLLIFFIAFLLLLIRILLESKDETVKTYSSLPLNDGEPQ